MPILPQTPSVFYSPFPSLLMLPAPKIAGLLGSGVQTPHTAPIHQEAAEPVTLVYDNPRLAALPPWAYSDLRREVTRFLDNVVALLTAESDRQAFAAADTHFAGQIALLYDLLVPADKQPPVPHFKTRAEMDADYDLLREQGRQQLIDLIERRSREREARRSERMA